MPVEVRIPDTYLVDIETAERLPLLMKFDVIHV